MMNNKNRKEEQLKDKILIQKETKEKEVYLIVILLDKIKINNK